MGLPTAYSILLLFSMVSLYYASHICEEGYYCPVHANCSGDSTQCQEGICPNTTESIANLISVGCDEAPIMLNFTQSSFSVSEGNGHSSPVLELTRAMECCTISVRVLIQDNTAYGGKDFVRPPGDYVEVVFPAGTKKESFDVTIINDQLHEKSETFQVMISEISVPHGVALSHPKSSVVTIIDNDAPTVEFESATYSVDEGAGVVVVLLTLSNPSDRDIPFKVYSIDETATDCDYGNGTYDVVIINKTQVAELRINITDDNVIESDETFRLIIDSSTLSMQVTVNGNRRTTVTIEDNEEMINVGFDQRMYRVHEDEEYIAPVLKLDKPANCCIIVRAVLQNMTAEGRNVDFGYAPSKIYNYTFYAGDSEALPDANISIVDDLHFEDKENFYISIINVSLPYGYQRGENGTATICIIDNDNGIEFVNTNETVYEDAVEGHVNLMLRLFRPAIFNVTVQLITVSTSATENADYLGGPYRVVIPQGEQEVDVAVEIYNDADQETDEKFNVIISPAGLPSDITPKMGGDLAEVTIINDDYDCVFNESTYIIDEGDSVTLHLSLTAAIYKDVAVDVAYFNQGTTNDSDYSYSTRNALFPAQIQQSFPLRISTTVDSRLESNEVINVVAVLPENRGSCRAQVIIVDDNTCEFSSEMYEVDEGDKVQLNLTLTKKLSEDVNIELEYYDSNSNDMGPLPETVSLVAGDTSVIIEIEALPDRILENNESLIVSAYPPSDDRRHCNTTLTIVDDNKLRISPSDITVVEGTTVHLTFTLDRPLLAEMVVPWRYQYEVYNGEEFVDGFLRFSRNDQEVKVTIDVIDDNVLEHDETFFVTARPPAEPRGSRDAIATITITDNEALMVEFEESSYTIRKDKIELEQPVLRLYGGTAAFNINFLLREIIGTAIGAEHNPSGTLIDYEEFNKNITILKGMDYYKFLIDTIDDDIVEPPTKYFDIQIDKTSLPQNVSVGNINETRIIIMDDDASYITLSYQELELTKGLYTEIRVNFTMMSGGFFEREIEAGVTKLQYPEGSTFTAIKKVQLFVPDSIRDRVIVREEDKRYAMITWVP